MDFLSLAKKRYSCRVYTDQPVESDKLGYVLEAGRVAPTAKNLQPFRVLVIQKEENLEKLSEAARIYGAPVALVVCKDKNNAWVRPLDGREFGDVDATIVTDHMLLAATEQGLQSVWICFFDAARLKESFNLPDHLEPVNILVMGYGADEPKSELRHKEMRRPLEESFYFESCPEVES
jgi:nitroreductase